MMKQYRKNYLFIALFIAVTAISISAQSFEQSSYIVNIVQDKVTSSTQILDAQLASLPFHPYSMPETGDVMFVVDKLYYISNDQVVLSESLHPGGGKIYDMRMENDGKAVVYVIDQGDEKTPLSMYVRKRVEGQTQFSEPILIRQHPAPPPEGRIHPLVASLAGDIVFWRENTPDSNDVLMMFDQSEGGAGVLMEFPTPKGGSDTINDITYLNQDGKTLIFTIQTLTEPRLHSYYTFRDEKGVWSEPKSVTIDGGIPSRAVDAMNSDGSILAVGNRVLQWNVNQYEVVRQFDFDYKEYGGHQISDDGKTLYMIASHTPHPNYHISDPPPRQFDLLQIHWSDDPKNPQINVIDSAHEINFRLLDGGQRLIYRARNFPTQVDTWGGY